MPISELMQHGAFAYQSSDADDKLGALAAATSAADRAGAAIDDALHFIDASNKRIAAIEAKIRLKATSKCSQERRSGRRQCVRDQSLRRTCTPHET